MLGEVPRPYPNRLIYPDRYPVDPPETILAKRSSQLLHNTGRLAILFTTGSLIPGAMSWYISDDPSLMHRAAIGYFVDRDCTGTPQVRQETVNDILDYARSDTRHGYDDLNYEAVDENYVEKIIQSAEKHNFKLIDYRPYLEAIEQAENIEAANDVLSNFTSHYGFSVSLHNSLDRKDTLSNVSPLELDKLELDEYKKGAESLMQSLFYLPPELVKYANIEELRIVESIKEGSGLTDLGSEIIYLDKETFLSEGGEDRKVMYHETFHLVDGRYCGLWGRERDDKFKDLNPAGFQYSHSAYANNAITEAARSSTFSDYGTSSITEDKADTAAEILNGLDSLIINTGSDIKDGKVKLLLGRIEAIVPGFTSYFADISTLPSTPAVFREHISVPPSRGVRIDIVTPIP